MAEGNKDLFGNPVETKEEGKAWNKIAMDTPELKAARIEKRRQRIAEKMAVEKGQDSTIVSNASSLEFLAHLGEVGMSSPSSKGKASKARRKTKSGTAVPTADAGFEDPQLDAQLDESRKQLEQIILDGETLITNVKVAAEYREKVRHDRLDESRKERIERLHREAQEAQEMYESINQNWMASAEKMLPMELYAKIQEQQQACDDLLEKQDEEVYNLKRELEDQDIEYEDNLEMYQKDVMLMGDRIDDTVDTLRNAFMEELELIEQYTVHDREALLEENQKEWMDLLHEYERIEKEAIEERKGDALGKFEKLTDLYGMVKQEARVLKNQMQQDMRTLFVEREQIKCSIQLNLEKLDYNLCVLRKREEENMKMKNSMKRLLLKLQDRFNAKAQSLRNIVTKGKKTSAQLIKDIRRLETLTDTAKCKTLHVYASDYHKFMDLWALNEEECREKLIRLLGSERYIVQEQLGTGFLEPDLSLLDRRPEQVQCFVDKVECCRKKSEEMVGDVDVDGGGGDGFRGSMFEEEADEAGADEEAGDEGRRSESSQSHLPSAMSYFLDDEKRMSEKETKRASIHIDPAHNFDFIPGPEIDPVIETRLMKHITKVICDQTGFLLEEKLRKLIHPFIDSEKQLIHIDTVLQALGVTHIDDMQVLARYILKQSRIMKGIISKPSLEMEDPDHMVLSVEGLKPEKPESEYNLLSNQGEDLEERLEEEERLTSTASEDTDTQLTKSAANVLSDLAFAGVRDIGEVHGIPMTAKPSVKEGRAHSRPGSSSKKDLQQRTSGSESDPSIVNIIKEFSSDASLEKVLHQVELYSEGPGEAVPESSSCSCESISGSESTKPGEGTDPFDSNKSRVLTWVTELATGLTSDCASTQQEEEYYGEDGGPFIPQAERPAKEGRVAEQTPRRTCTRPSAPETAEAGFGLGEEEEEEVLGEYEFQARGVDMDSAGQSCDLPPSEQSGYESPVSIPPTEPDSSEFFYIEPNDVLRAIAAFCQDHQSNVKAEMPTKSELCDARISKICFPAKDDVKEYWDRFLGLLDPKSKILWEGIQEVFLEYDENLKARNQYVEDIVQLYRQNYELSHLLKKHVQRGIQSCSPRNQVGPFNPANIPYCQFPCQVPKPRQKPPSFPPCPPSTTVQVQQQPQTQRMDDPNINE